MALPRLLAMALRPFQRFLATESSSGIVLLLATVAAFALANSRLGDFYHRLLSLNVTVGIAGRALSWPLHHWINDGLMAVFFLVVGMEIKREVVRGQLRGVRRVMLPALAAVGGMALPAAIFLALNPRSPATLGWGIPVATDIAFALGCLSLLGKRVPPSLAVFLAALAIFDDIGAILVIAVFYGQAVSVPALLVAAGLLVVLVVLNLFGVRRLWPFLLLGVALWLAMLQSGVHATLAGVLLGLCLPSRPLRDPADATVLRSSLESPVEEIGDAGERNVAAAEDFLSQAQPPLDRLLHALHPWVAFGIVPVFALANAGVHLPGGHILTPVSVGVAAGLFVGKQVGVFAAVWLAVRTGLSPMPERARWPHIYGVAMLAGIGFTMSLFVGALAYGAEDALATEAKLGVLAGSLLSALGGLALLRSLPAESPDGLGRPSLRSL